MKASVVGSRKVKIGRVYISRLEQNLRGDHVEAVFSQSGVSTFLASISVGHALMFVGVATSSLGEKALQGLDEPCPYSVDITDRSSAVTKWMKRTKRAIGTSCKVVVIFRRDLEAWFISRQVMTTQMVYLQNTKFIKQEESSQGYPEIPKVDWNHRPPFSTFFRIIFVTVLCNAVLISPFLKLSIS